MLDTEPNTSHCNNQATLAKWKDVGPVKLSWIAMNAQVPIDLDDEFHRLDERNYSNGDREIRTVDKLDNKILDNYLRRIIYEDGQIYEGQFCKSANGVSRVINPNRDVLTGFWKGVEQNGP